VQPDGAFVDTTITELGWLVDNARRPESGHVAPPELLEAIRTAG
jgi:hypothetical protein